MLTTLTILTNNHMMGYGYGGMMGGGFGVVFAVVAIIDLILLGVWLYKQINK